MKNKSPIVGWRWARRHPCEKTPWWLNELAEDIRYWLRRTAHLRHSEPFNKRDAGRLRRAQKRFKLNERNGAFIHDPNNC